MLCPMFWGTRGVIAVDFFPKQQTENAQYYSNVLKCTVNPAYRSKQRDIPICCAILQQDSARLNTTQFTMETLNELGWETLKHPAYNPDLRLIYLVYQKKQTKGSVCKVCFLDNVFPPHLLQNFKFTLHNISRTTV